MKIKLLSDRILIETDDKETKTGSGLIIPPKNEPGDVQIGTVVEVGPGKVTDGALMKVQGIEKGDRVMFQFGTPMSLEGKNYILVGEADVVMVLN